MELLVAVFLLNFSFIPLLFGLYLAELIVLRRHADCFTSSFYKLFFVLAVNVSSDMFLRQ